MLQNQPENPTEVGKRSFMLFGRIKNGVITMTYFTPPNRPAIHQSGVVTNNKPYSGQYNATIRNGSENLVGTSFRPGQKVIILLETLKKEADGSPGKWTIGVIKADNPDPQPTCIFLGLLNVSARTRREINAAKKKLEQFN
jgi:hypothetical protein